MGGLPSAVVSSTLAADLRASGSPCRARGRRRPRAVETKLRPPWSRPGLVLRSALVARLAGSVAPIVTIIAPAGYGRRPSRAWVAARHSVGVAVLGSGRRAQRPLASLLAALARIEPIEPNVERALLADSVEASWSLRRLAALVSSIRTPFLLVLDHVETVEDQRSHDLIAALALNLPAGTRLALASRRAPHSDGPSAIPGTAGRGWQGRADDARAGGR